MALTTTPRLHRAGLPLPDSVLGRGLGRGLVGGKQCCTEGVDSRWLKKSPRSGEVLRVREQSQKAQEQTYTRLSNCVECSKTNKKPAEEFKPSFK